MSMTVTPENLRNYVVNLITEGTIFHAIDNDRIKENKEINKNLFFEENTIFLL